MITVGIRNLKNSLSQYITMVKSGEKVLITDHNRVVAQLVPSSGASSVSGLLREYLDAQILEASIQKATRQTIIKQKKRSDRCDESLLKRIYAETRDERV